MVKHNNIIPNIHCKKKYCQSSRGPLKVKLALNQATRKKARRLRRAAKAATTTVMQKLRPVVHCPTQKYSAKTRLGKGFTLEELRLAKLNPSYAMTVGIAIDWRRRNHCEESLQANVARLQAYQEKLVVFKKTKADDKADVPPPFAGTIQPLASTAPSSVELQTVTSELQNFAAYTTMRVARQETKVAGQRIAVVNRKKNE